jgi:hypothetical protein
MFTLTSPKVPMNEGQMKHVLLHDSKLGILFQKQEQQESTAK